MAKIPIILEAGRADGKLIKTNSVYDDNQEKFLSDKIKEIDDNHNTLKDNVNILTEVVNNNESDIETKLEKEKNRATNAENNLRETVNNITNINEHAATAELITVNTLPNSTVSNVQQALDDLYKNIIYDVSQLNGGIVFESLQALLSSSNVDTLIPMSVRHGGMSIRFVQSSNNKYVQFRLINQNWSTVVTDWQGVDYEPTLSSKNLIESGGTLRSDLLVKAHASLLNYNKQTAQVTMTSDKSKVNTGIYLYQNRTYIIKCTSLTSLNTDAYAGIYLGDTGTPFVRISPEEFNNGFVTENTIPTLQYVRSPLFVRTGTNADIVDIEVYDVTIEKTIPQRIAEYDIEQKIKQSILSEAFAFSNFQYINGNLTSATIVWFDGTNGTMTIVYNADSTINYIRYKYKDDYYKNTFTYNADGSVTNNTITKE